MISKAFSNPSRICALLGLFVNHIVTYELLFHGDALHSNVLILSNLMFSLTIHQGNIINTKEDCSGEN